MALPAVASVPSTVTSNSLKGNGRLDITRQQQHMRCPTVAVRSACRSPRLTAYRIRTPLPALAPALLPAAGAPRGVACSARKPKWDSEDFAEQVADQVTLIAFAIIGCTTLQLPSSAAALERMRKGTNNLLMLHSPV